MGQHSPEYRISFNLPTAIRTSLKDGENQIEVMRFVVSAYGFFGVGYVEIVVTAISHGVKLRNDEGDADENVENRQEREMNDRSR